VTLREVRFSRLFIGVMFAGLWIWAFADARYAFGAFWLAASAIWLLTGAFGWPVPRDLKSRDDT
jgi:hypothetical protein